MTSNQLEHIAGVDPSCSEALHGISIFLRIHLLKLVHGLHKDVPTSILAAIKRHRLTKTCQNLSKSKS